MLVLKLLALTPGTSSFKEDALAPIRLDFI